MSAFLENYPSVSKKHAIEVLKYAEKFVTTDAKIAVKSFEESHKKFIVVVYKETGREDGFIITAYFSKNKQE